MKKFAVFCGSLLMFCAIGEVAAAASQSAPEKSSGKTSKTKTATARPAAKKTKVAESAHSEDFKSKLEEILKLPPAERIAALQELIQTYLRSSLLVRAKEQLTSARAALGDEKLKAGDTAGGIELFRLAVIEAPSEISDKLFVEIISQLPANLFLRGEGVAAIELARLIEERIKGDAKRLLTLATFYVSVEQPEEAARLAELARTLAPDLVAAHMALGAAHRVALRLDQAATAYARALELDPQSTAARRSLADLQRAQGRSAEALKLYREQMNADPQDKTARTGLTLALFDSGEKEAAEKELHAALADDPQNLPLMVGAAYWYAAHDDAPRALELATQAVRLEPRYTWAQIVLARALVAQQRHFEAERALRFARQYGRFPTLDYELASALAASGLYEEAAEELAKSFTLKENRIEARLAGRIATSADNFIDLLAAERRASIFQPVAADTATNAQRLKALLALHLTLQNTAEPGATNAAATAGVAAATAFVAGDDEMQAYRQLYAASRLLRRGMSPAEALKLSEAAMSKVEVALNSPITTMALMADELRDYRTRALAADAPLNLPEVPRHTLSNILRGRLEDAAGWSLLMSASDQAPEAIVRLRRATSVLPEGSPWWRTAHWHLGAAFEANGKQTEALAAYLKSYNRQSPDLARRAIIEALYKRLHGSLDGLDAKLGSAPMTLSSASPVATAPSSSNTASETTPPPTVAAAAATTATSEATTPATPNTPGIAESASAATSSASSLSPTPVPDAPVTTPPTPAPTAPEAMPLPPEAAAATKIEATLAPVATPEAIPATTSATEAGSATRTETVSPPVTETSSTSSAPVPMLSPAPEQTASLTASSSPPTPEPTATPLPALNTTEPVASISPAAPPTSVTPEQGPAPNQDGDQVGQNKGACTLSISESALNIKPGSSALVSVTLHHPIVIPAEIKITSPSWSDIIVLADAHVETADSQMFRYTITSIGKTPGTFTITFISPCGKQEMTVTVQ